MMISSTSRVRMLVIVGLIMLLMFQFLYIFKDRFIADKDDVNTSSTVNHNLKLQQQTTTCKPIVKTIVQEASCKEDPTKCAVVSEKLKSCEDHLGRCQQLQRLRVVMINTGETHSQIRTLIGSLHHHHKGQIKAVIYGLNLPPAKVSEVLLWDHVEYIDLEQEFISAIRIEENTDTHLQKKLWKPLVIKHSVEVFGKILFVDDYLMFQSSLLNSQLLKDLEADGHFYAGDSCHSDPQVQGYVLDSPAYKQVLVPLVECARRKCSKKDIKLSNDPSSTYPCKTIPGDIIRRQGGPHEAADKKEVCYLQMREDFITSGSQLPGFTRKAWNMTNTERSQLNNGKIHIALGFPSTTKGNGNPTIDNVASFAVLIPTFLSSIEKNENGKYMYSLYLAYDQSDAFYNNPQNRKSMMDTFNNRASGYPAKLIFVQCVDSNGWVPFLWNVAFQHAMDDGADYFYQLNDDIRIESPGWSDVFVNALQSSPVHPDFGVTGPLDGNNGGILTQAFVSKLHYEIFGFLYPYVFKNWYSDDWITVIYNDWQSNLRNRHDAMRVFNSQTFGTRYEVCDMTGKVDLQSALDIGKERIRYWLEENKK